MQLCQSFESIGSFDWSREVESEYNAKHGEEKDDHSSGYQERGESLHNGSAPKDLPHGDGPHSSLSMRDSDRSSLRSSIVEEEFDESCEPSSGECTPTEESGDEKHWNSRRTPQLIKSSAGYSGGDDVHKENRGGRLMGRVTVDRSRREPNATEAIPLASRTTRVPARNEPRRTYKPPAMRRMFCELKDKQRRRGLH
ncbi:hypothetical protein TELCIR_18152 [Teladorsagia circumcincta]|uniref:Uncharacterized protein n=1 Tax=Teladorsagia circumcincta TaxID=45464 RepID=A0A2G9TSB5_TELCI|nr:hypothetical protein TELCIR_18152 [Teladorsagia circumcincta]